MISGIIASSSSNEFELPLYFDYPEVMLVFSYVDKVPQLSLKVPPVLELKYKMGVEGYADLEYFYDRVDMINKTSRRGEDATKSDFLLMKNWILGMLGSVRSHHNELNKFFQDLESHSRRRT